MKRAIVVGSGAGGATAAKELQGRFDVTVLEAGKGFRPLSLALPTLEKLRRTGLLFDEREIQLIFPPMHIQKTTDAGMILVRGVGLGGTTTLCTGNALRMDHDLKAIGINLDAEFEEIYHEIPIGTDHQKRWHKLTRHLFALCDEMGLNPQPTPKMGNYDQCIHCGRCVLGCQSDVRWDSRRFLDVAVQHGAHVVTDCTVESVVIEGCKATGVRMRQGLLRRVYTADLVVLAAGGLGTPIILQNSGITCEPTLFVDPVLCVAAHSPKSWQCREVPMPFVMQRNGYILSPYFDLLSFFFNKTWRYPAQDILAFMVKLADSNVGSISRTGLDKHLTDQDRSRLDEGVRTCKQILCRYGAREDDLFLGSLNAGHPGGMLPLTHEEAETLHHAHLPENLYVADATLLPRARGNPPILTIIALAKRVSHICAQLA